MRLRKHYDIQKSISDKKAYLLYWKDTTSKKNMKIIIRPEKKLNNQLSETHLTQ